MFSTHLTSCLVSYKLFPVTLGLLWDGIVLGGAHAPGRALLLVVYMFWGHKKLSWEHGRDGEI